MVLLILSIIHKIRHLWQLKTTVFLHWCLKRALLLQPSYFTAAVSYERKLFVKSAPGNLAPDSGKRGGTGSWGFGARPGYRVASAIAWPVWNKSTNVMKCS
jgi:hypothetical protein